MRYSMRVFARHTEPKVTIFGSARVPASDPNYQMAEQFAEIMAKKHWGVITGAGPGIMRAGNKGAGREASYGVAIRLPFEEEPNPNIDPERLTRKLEFVKESHAFALFPGGFGTLDETFELLTLIQTGKSDLHPIVFLEAEGTGYWDELFQFIEDDLVKRGFISASDTELFTLATDAQDAADIILRFYANYQSQRYVDGRLVLRLRKAPTVEELNKLNQDFKDIVVRGDIEIASPSEAERADGDSLDLQRVAFVFDRRQYGRLRSLVDELNLLVDQPTEVRPPAPFTEEHEERPW
jgi:uncharacterized protein (TIGR00730 family)